MTGTTLTNPSNDFTGVNATNTGPGAIQIVDNALPLLDITGINQSGTGPVSIANTGNIGITGPVATTGNFTVTPGNGNTITLGNGANINTGGVMTLAGSTAINAPVNINANQGAIFGVPNGAGTFLNAGPINVTTLNGPITFNGPVNGAQNLFLNAGPLGNITFNGNVGNIAPPTLLQIVNANNVTSNGVMNVVQFIQLAGNGTTNFVGGLNASGGAYITTKIVDGIVNANPFVLNDSGGDTINNTTSGDAAANSLDSIAEGVVEAMNTPYFYSPQSAHGQPIVLTANNETTPNPEQNIANLLDTDSSGCVSFSGVQVCIRQRE